MTAILNVQRLLPVSRDCPIRVLVPGEKVNIKGCWLAMRHIRTLVAAWYLPATAIIADPIWTFSSATKNDVKAGLLCERGLSSVLVGMIACTPV